ncbi:S1C family serine protease [Actinophytocola glycyrrhizae]|uniref:S1C family serine protease n=1 Tax=Actinophytocola glycyrrhizae TaxID=2044873 RepID=A0ABV9S2A9_9PSEU
MSTTTARTAVPALTAALALTLTGCTTGDAGTTRTQTQTNTRTTGTEDRPGHADVVARLAPSVVTIQTGNGLGSGVVLREDVVVSNAHVVGEAREVTVVYADGERSPGTVLATDTVTDLAVVRTERGDLPVPEYRTGLPRPGEIALAIGSPLGFENTVTAGIVSGLHRDIPGSAATTRSLVDLIQTDAPISPGNSGGALLDEQGRVIGVNEAYLPPETGAVSLGFAVPAATVLDVAEQLIADGEAEHPYLGVSLRGLTPAIRDTLGIQADHGAVVTAVDENGPAAAAGVRAGDVVTGFDDAEVRTVEDLLTALRGTEPGATVTLAVLRDGDRLEHTVDVTARTS